MAQPMTPQSIRNLGVNGVIRQAEVDDSLIPDGAVVEAVNFHFDRKGTATVRPGTANLGGTSVITFSAGGGNPCIGMHNTQGSYLLAFFYSGTAVLMYRLNPVSNTWASSSPGTFQGINATVKMRAVDFSNGFGVVSGTAAGSGKGMANLQFSGDNSVDVTSSSLGLSTITAGSMAPSLIEVYKSRMYLSGDYLFPSRLYFSSVIDTNGVITWNPSTDYVDINPGDGEVITGMKRYSLELVMFKPNYMYRYRTSGLDPDPLIKIGTRSQESIVEGKRGLYFAHDTGFFRYSGSYPEEISLPIIDIVKAIPVSQLDDIIGWTDGYNIYWSLGNLAIGEGNTVWKNVVVRYTESSDVWTVYEYPYDIRRAGPYLTKTTSSIVIALDNGSVGVFNYGLTDTGEPIKFRLITPWYEWDGIQNRKTIQTMIALAEKGMGASLMYQTNDENSDWKGFGNDLREPVTVLADNNIKFNRIRFKTTGVTTRESPVFRGLEVIEGINEGFIKQWPKS